SSVSAPRAPSHGSPAGTAGTRPRLSPGGSLIRRGIPIVTMAVMTAMVVTAAALKWCARPATSAGGSPALPREGVARAEGSAAGLGAGPPPGDAGAVATGVPMLHGDARRTHRAVGRIPGAAPSLVWSRDVGGPVEGQVTASPDEKTLYAASLGGSLTA